MFSRLAKRSTVNKQPVATGHASSWDLLHSFAHRHVRSCPEYTNQQAHPRMSAFALPSEHLSGNGAQSMFVDGPVSPEQSLATLQERVGRLSDVVNVQQAMITKQQVAIDELQRALASLQHQQQPDSSMLSSMSTNAATVPTNAATAPDTPATSMTTYMSQDSFNSVDMYVRTGAICSPGFWEVQQHLRPAPLPPLRPFDAQLQASTTDRRSISFDARFHSASPGATPRDYRRLPANIILVRHAESVGNLDEGHYTRTPDPSIELSPLGHEQARRAGVLLREMLDAKCGTDYQVFFYTSPYRRSLQTTDGISSAFNSKQMRGVQQDVQLREQDFGNFQDAAGKKREKAERERFGRFFYRFPNGESGADLYDRLTMFEDHLIRDINAGRFGVNANIVICTHGLALRIFLMRWFGWTVDQFMEVWNPPNAVPIVLRRATDKYGETSSNAPVWVHTKAVYQLSEASKEVLIGISNEMCSSLFVDSG